MNKEPEKTNEHLHHFAVHQKLTQNLTQLYFNKKKCWKDFANYIGHGIIIWHY